jgi:hypothetical protein
MKAHLNTAGIMLTIIGALLIWFFLGELNFAKKDEYLKGGELEIPVVGQFGLVRVFCQP